MAKKLAIDWDEHELRIVAGRTSPSGVTISDAWTLPLESPEPAAVIETLRTGLAERGYGKQPVLLAIGRGKAELRQLKLPPIPLAELPEVVRFQATRDFATSGDRAITDFVPSRISDDQVEVVAAALDPQQLDQLKKVSEGAGLEVQRVALRPLSAAALFAAQQPTAGEVVLIDLLADDADIVVLREGQARSVRSVRLAGDPGPRSKLLAGEVRRSLMACRTASDDSENARRLLIWGKAAVHAEDVRVLAEQSGSSVETIDPLDLVELDSKLRAAPPEHSGRFAPLIGLLQVDEAGSDLMLDFLNPRKPPEPRNDRARYALFGSLAAAVVLLIGYLVWNNLSQRDTQIADLQAQLDAMSETVELSEAQVAKVAKVDEFLSGNVVWLKEIRRVAEEMPPSDQAILTSLAAMVPPRSGGGQLTLAGAVTRPDVIDALEASLRDDQHRVLGEGATAASSEGPYDWGFRETVVLDPSAVQAMRRQADQTPLAPPTAAPAHADSPVVADTDNDADTDGDGDADADQDPDADANVAAAAVGEADAAASAPAPDEAAAETQTNETETTEAAGTEAPGTEAPGTEAPGTESAGTEPAATSETPADGTTETPTASPEDLQ